MQIKCRSFELVRKLIPKCSLSYPKIRSKLSAIQRACSICIAETQPILFKDNASREKNNQTWFEIVIPRRSLSYSKIMQIECRSFELVRKLIPKCSLSYPKIRSKLSAIQRACSICIAGNVAMSSPVPPCRRGIGTLSHGQCDFVT